MPRNGWLALLLLLALVGRAESQLISGGAASGGGSGTVTNVGTSAPLSGGPITTTGTIACPTCTFASSALTNNGLVLSGSGYGLTSLADVATGQVLTSGGVGVAPLFTGSPTLSGTLTASAVVTNGTANGFIAMTNVGGLGFSYIQQVGNPAATYTFIPPIAPPSGTQCRTATVSVSTITEAYGDCGGASIGGTVTGGTAKSVLFLDTGPVLAQDNANFAWDSTNHRLGIGTNAPIVPLEIVTTLADVLYMTSSATNGPTLAIRRDNSGGGGTTARIVFGTTASGGFYTLGTGAAAASGTNFELANLANGHLYLSAPLNTGEYMVGNATDTTRIRSSLAAPASPANGDWWVECTGTSPSRVCSHKVQDGGATRIISSITY